jgi:O-antigen/teichoic acid export membrane protein
MVEESFPAPLELASGVVPEAPPTYADTRSLALLGVRLMLVRQVAILLMSAVGTTYLIRRLGPSVWGGFGTSYLLLVTLDNVLSHSLIAGLLRKEVATEPRLLASAAGLCVTAGVLLAGLLALVSRGVGRLYTAPHFPLLLLATSVCVVFYAARSLPLTLLERRLAYGVVAGSEIADMTAFYLLAVPLVIAGAGVWALVAATVGRGLITFAFVRARERAPLIGRSPRLAAAQLLPFGAPLAAVVGISLLDALVAVALIGRHPTQFGFLVVATTILGYGVAASQVVQRVAIPSFARLEGEEFRHAVRRSAELANFITVGIMLLAGGLAPLWLVPLLGNTFRPGLSMLMLIALGLMPTGPIGVYSAALTARGASRPVLGAQVASLIGYTACGAVLVAVVGPVGVAAGYAASRWMWAALLVVMSRRRLSVVPDHKVLVPLLTGLVAGAALTAEPWRATVLIPSAAALVGTWLFISRRQFGSAVKALLLIRSARRGDAGAQAVPASAGAGHSRPDRPEADESESR